MFQPPCWIPPPLRLCSAMSWGSSEPGRLAASASCPSTPPSLPAWVTQVGWEQHRPQQPCPGHASQGEVLGPGPEQALGIMRMLRGAQQPTRSSPSERDPSKYRCPWDPASGGALGSRVLRPVSHPPGQQTPATLRKKTLFGMKIERPPLPLSLLGCRPGDGPWREVTSDPSVLTGAEGGAPNDGQGVSSPCYASPFSRRPSCSSRRPIRSPCSRTSTRRARSSCITSSSRPASCRQGTDRLEGPPPAPHPPSGRVPRPGVPTPAPERLLAVTEEVVVAATVWAGPGVPAGRPSDSTFFRLTFRSRCLLGT